MTCIEKLEETETMDCTRCWDQEIPETEDRPSYLNLPEPETSIKDSGDRTKFETGAVRDMHEGKGRCDLMPLDVVAECYVNAENVNEVYTVFKNLHGFTNTGDTDFLTAIIQITTIFENQETMFLEVAKHFEEGCKKYGENNWRKGIPTHCYIDSAVRHYLKHLRGDTDERHDRAFVWNILCCIWTCIHKPELNDYKKES